jgi:hypothetical protein
VKLINVLICDAVDILAWERTDIAQQPVTLAMIERQRICRPYRPDYRAGDRADSQTQLAQSQ